MPTSKSSKPESATKKAPAKSAPQSSDVKPAGKQPKKQIGETFEPGVEG